jgi:hypothetical protein
VLSVYRFRRANVSPDAVTDETVGTVPFNSDITVRTMIRFGPKVVTLIDPEEVEENID